MNRRHGSSRKRRRNLLCGGWLASLAAAAITALAFCPPGTAQCSALLLAILAGGALWHPLMKREGGVAVLIYHSVSDQGEWLPGSRDICVSPEIFSRHMALLRRMRCSVLRTADMVEARRTGRPLGRRPVVIHFDDGYLDNWVAALPLLQRHDFPATVFVSVDFVAAGDRLRPTLTDVEAGCIDRGNIQWEGYMNWAELRAMQQSGLIDVECHGTDHGRVPVSERTVGRLTVDNWRQHAWMQWRHMAGDKSNWYRYGDPPFEQVGTPIPESGSALAARAWCHGKIETNADYERRVYESLHTARQTLEAALDKPVRYFCWPFNESTPTSHDIALKAGFLATTGGDGENRSNEDPIRISRVHVAANTISPTGHMLDGLIFKATVRLMQGNYYWGLLVIPANALRRVVQVLASFTTESAH